MSEDLFVDGKTYISSKRASDSSGYAQDYIGQLARKGLVDAKRIGGLWYVSMASLEAYKKNAENFKPEPPLRSDAQEPGTLVFFDGKEYLSAARASQVTGYAQDYVGQLARTGAILSRQVGNRWYVEKRNILDHKREKDALLAAVQVESVGLSRGRNGSLESQEYLAKIRHSGPGPFLNYFHEGGDLIPDVREMEEEADPVRIGPWVEERPKLDIRPTGAHSIPIRRVRYEPRRYSPVPAADLERPIVSKDAKKNPVILLLAGTVATIVIVLSVGYESVLKKNAIYAGNTPLGGPQSLAASAEAVFGRIGDILEPLLTHELIYERPADQ